MEKDNKKKDNDNGTLVGLREMLRKAQAGKHEPKADFDVNSSTKNYAGGNTPMNFAIGGPVPPEVDPAMQIPPLNETAAAMKQVPDTNYDFYKDISADDRSRLYNQLLNKQNSGGNLVAQAAGGIGDAISNSFGGQHNKFQDEAAGIAAKNTENRIGAMDTQRAQRMQDMQGNQAVMMSDPNHPIAVAMRKTLQANGMQVPSGMPIDLMIKVAGPLGELALKQATLAQNASQFDVTSGRQAEGLKRQQEKDAEEAKQKKTDTEIGAAKSLNAEGPLQRFTNWIHPDAAHQALTAQLPQTPDHGIPDLGSTFNGGKVLKIKRIN